MSHTGAINGRVGGLRRSVAPSAVFDRLRSVSRRLGGYRLLLLLVVPGVAFALITFVMKQLGIVSWDAPAHLYKIALVQEGQAIFWDNQWYGGAYDVVSYGFVFYLLAKFLNYTVLVAASAGALPVLFYLYMRRTYGSTSYWPAVALALVLCAYLANGQDPFVFAMALMMAGMVLLAYRHPLLAVLPAAASIFANPLAFVVGAIFLLAEFVSRPERRRTYLRYALFLSPFIAVRLLVGLLFYERASYVYNLGFVLLFAVFGVVGYVLCRLSQDAQRGAKGTLFLTFSAASLALAVIPGNPIGWNVGRFFFLFGVPLLVDIRKIAAPRLVVGALILGFACGQVIPPASHYVHVADLPSTRAAFFTSALAFAGSHYDPDYRFHVVALDTHWEAYYFSISGFPITRGWYRQADALHNEVLSRNFTAPSYVGWLRDMGVQYVFLPHAPLDWSGERETAILQSSSAFVKASEGTDWTIYRFLNPSPIAVALNGGRDPDVLGVLHQAVYLQVPQPGRYLLKVTYSPYWEVTAGSGTLARSTDGKNFLVLNALGSGFYGVQVRVTLESSLRELVRVF